MPSKFFWILYVTMPLKLQTDGAKKTGCFNTACPGFVQVDNRYYTGSPLSNVSIFDGPQFEIALSISKVNISLIKLHIILFCNINLLFILNFETKFEKGA